MRDKGRIVLTHSHTPGLCPCRQRRRLLSGEAGLQLRKMAGKQKWQVGVCCE